MTNPFRQVAGVSELVFEYAAQTPATLDQWGSVKFTIKDVATDVLMALV